MLKKLKPTPSYKIENSKVIASKEVTRDKDLLTFTANETYMCAILPASGSSKEYKIYISKGAH